MTSITTQMLYLVQTGYPLPKSAVEALSPIKQAEIARLLATHQIAYHDMLDGEHEGYFPQGVKPHWPEKPVGRAYFRPLDEDSNEGDSADYDEDTNFRDIFVAGSFRKKRD